ncbi:hypothetical protein HYS31_05645 [Candidatus Woesearchaeota archaeon]|nr:hypothetical protein [Candidatus Woesearchaeota archaeon]
MEIWVHGMVSLILAAVLYPAYGWQASFVLIGGVLIDIDHYIWYVLKYRKLGFRDCYRHFTADGKANNYKDVTGVLIIFHTIEFLAVMAILSAFSALALLFTIGLVFHFFLDLLWLYLYHKRFIADHSLLHWIYRNRIQKA